MLRVGSARLDLPSGVLEANVLFKANFGWSPDAPVTWDALQGRLQPQDRARLATARAAVLSGAAVPALTVCASWPGVESRCLVLRLGLLAGQQGSGGLLLAVSDAGEEPLSKELERVRCDGEAAHRAHQERLGVLSHDLRSPLNAMLGWIRILSMKYGADPQIAAIVERLERGARSQIRVLEGLSRPAGS